MVAELSPFVSSTRRRKFVVVRRKRARASEQVGDDAVRLSEQAVLMHMPPSVAIGLYCARRNMPWSQHRRLRRKCRSASRATATPARHFQDKDVRGLVMGLKGPARLAAPLG
jgi:hypothetical protein